MRPDPPSFMFLLTDQSLTGIVSIFFARTTSQHEQAGEGGRAKHILEHPTSTGNHTSDIAHRSMANKCCNKLLPLKICSPVDLHVRKIDPYLENT